ncbi:IclR family transcriptional regulator domain-containing protein [Streptomyces griseicoloratus]|nr:IclR family transcriptional regulator C-terminal domain-containing protein [Streptomyces griseicoloratus]
MNEDDPQGQPPLLVLGEIRAILECFAPQGPELTLPEIRRATGLPSSTCRRLVEDLAREGFLDRTGDAYRIGLALVRMAAPGLYELDPVRRIQPFLDELRDSTGETACLYVRDGLYCSVVGLAETRHVVRRAVALGTVDPLHEGSAGRVFLAHDEDAWRDVLEQGPGPVTGHTVPDVEQLAEQRAAVRRRGHAVSFEEGDVGSVSVSAPVFGVHGRLVAVLGIVAPVQRLTPADVPGTAALVVASAAGASRAIGCPPALLLGEPTGAESEAAEAARNRVGKKDAGTAHDTRQPGEQICAMGDAPSGATWGRVSHALFRAGRLHRVHAGTLLRRVGLYPGQEILLMLLWDEDHRAQADLIRALALDASTVTKMLQRLEQAGFITRSPSPTDRRASVVSLTDAGQALRDQVADLWHELEQDATTLLSEEETTAVTGILGKIEEGLQQRLPGDRDTDGPPARAEGSPRVG